MTLKPRSLAAMLVFCSVAVLLTACSAGSVGREPASAPRPAEVPGEPAPGRTQSPDGESGDATADPLTIANLIDRWEAAVRNVVSMTESNNHMYWLGGFRVTGAGTESLQIDHVWGQLEERDHVHLTGYARKDSGRIDRLFVRGPQTDFADPDLERLRPYYEILIAVTNPGLSDEQRTGVMRHLLLDGLDAATLLAVLDERSQLGQGMPRTTVNGVSYLVDTGIASSEGMTVALVATLASDCAAAGVLPCR